jgi:hypothetical protein
MSVETKILKAKSLGIAKDQLHQEVVWAMMVNRHDFDGVPPECWEHELFLDLFYSDHGRDKELVRKLFKFALEKLDWDNIHGALTAIEFGKKKI